MHILYLAIVADILLATLMDLTEDNTYFSGSSRESRLEEIWTIYLDWCNDAKVTDRAQKRLFSVATLRAGGGKYVDISQKLMSAAASRFMIFFLAAFMSMLLKNAVETPELLWMAAVCWSLAAMEKIMVEGPTLVPNILFFRGSTINSKSFYFHHSGAVTS